MADWGIWNMYFITRPETTPRRKCSQTPLGLFSIFLGDRLGIPSVDDPMIVVQTTQQRKHATPTPTKKTVAVLCTY